MKNPYVRLIARLSVVLVAIILISKIHDTDEHVLAQVGADKIMSAVKSNDRQDTEQDATESNPYLIEVAENDREDKAADEPLVIADPVTEEVQETLQADAEETDVKVDPVSDADVEGTDTDEAEAPDTDQDVSEQEPGEENVESESPDPNDPTLYAGLDELQAAELHAKLDPDYKEQMAYIEALLVTHPDHYNERIVSEARSLPLESNDARYEFLTGKGYRAYTTKDMPAGFDSESRARSNMVTFDVPVWKIGSSGKRYSTVWSITIHKNLASCVRCIFSDIYQLDIKFPFNYLKGFNYRKVGGSGLIASPYMSIHAFGAAIDINFWDADNDYYLGKGNDLRDKTNPYCIPDEVIGIFADYGWYWGGNFEICADTMHFQYFGLEFLQYESDEPFPILYRGAENMDSTYIRNLAQRLVRLGYLDEETSKFTKKVDAALKAFQEEYGLETDGIADYETWVPLINATHDMSYVF